MTKYFCLIWIEFWGFYSPLSNKNLAVIGDPTIRYSEDPVRMMRALRIAEKNSLHIETKAALAIKQLSHLITNIPAARLFDETIKWFFSGTSIQTYNLFSQYQLFPQLFPQTANSLKTKIAEKMLRCGFINTYKRIEENKPINPAFLFAVLLWWPLQETLQEYRKPKLSILSTLQPAMWQTIQQQCNRISIPKHLIRTIKEIWTLQYRLQKQNRRSRQQAYYNPRFRAAYDFLLLRAAAGEPIQQHADWWTKFQAASNKRQREMLNN